MRQEFSTRIKREAYERSEGLCEGKNMKRFPEFLCSHCGTRFVRRYRMNATRMQNPQYCSRQCVAWAGERKADERAYTRFFARVDKSGGAEACWPWVGRKDRRGYGRFDQDNKPRLAHRIAYYLRNPGADRSLVVCHSCDNPPCCNPSHLWLGTQADNNMDRDKKGRTRTGTVRGEASNKAKLTSAQASEIFASADSVKSLAARYGISDTAVRLIKSGRNWAHVTGARHAS